MGIICPGIWQWNKVDELRLYQRPENSASRGSDKNRKIRVGACEDVKQWGQRRGEAGAAKTAGK